MADFQDLEIIREGGVVARITSRERATGYTQFTFSLLREFERPGASTEQSKFLTEEQLPALRRVLDQVEARLIAERTKVHARRREARR